MVGNGGQSSRAVGVELHLRTAVWGQQAVLALSGLAAVPDRRLVDQRRGDSGQRGPDIFDAAFQQYGRRSTGAARDRKSTRLNSSHLGISYAVFCLKKKNKKKTITRFTHASHASYDYFTAHAP